MLVTEGPVDVSGKGMEVLVLWSLLFLTRSAVHMKILA